MRLPIAADAPVERLIARLAAALRLRALHATVLGRARTLKAERNIVAEMPAGDPLDDATVLLVGRGRHHPTLSVAVGERMGVMGALSVDAAARCLDARDIDGVVIGDGLPRGLGRGASWRCWRRTRASATCRSPCSAPAATSEALPNFVRARDPLVLLERAVPLIRLHAFEARAQAPAASRSSARACSMPQTGLLNVDAFGRELGRAIDDAGERGVGLSLARFSFEQEIDRRASLDAARLVSRLVRDVDFACRQDDGSILFAFADTDLRVGPCGGAPARERAQAHHAAARPRAAERQPERDAGDAEAGRHRAHAAGARGAAPGCRRLTAASKSSGPASEARHVRRRQSHRHAASRSTSSRTWSAPGASSESDDWRRPWR